jgi:hypothetical protein
MIPYTVQFGGVEHPCGSLLEASVQLRLYITANGFGARDLRRHDGDVRDPAGKLVAKVSYNGRVWDVDGNEIPVHAPRQGGAR